ncbi:signal peptidase I [Rhodoferax sp. 4810]|uniref:Signal peptidase I n=1 Tax=Thiospirillum jenense TaxID=1653858 RepID=A0A839HBY3_9GAMM|nr:signal peptidase I [Thiospirillum jenense]MBB1074322.1 signal peptidase I [Rhodoferax jenense]MBB1126473.1 signal peptidase I [Thiospirillum jenense]
MTFDFPTFLVLATAITGMIWLIDAVILVPRRKRHNTNIKNVNTPKHESIVVEYARSFFPVLLVVLLLRSFLVEPFRIPSGSMMPTLLVGDFILVNKFAYGLRWPVLNSKFIDVGEPHRGDVVVFRFPRQESVDYIKRVVGVPGDKVEYFNKTLYVNDLPMVQTPQNNYIGTGAGSSQTGMKLALEDLTGRPHQVLINPNTFDFPPGCDVLAHGAIVIPNGQYFVMGDNRDNSNDSRCWGFVPEDHLVGKAFAIWMNWDGERAGFPIAWERLGNGIE